MALSIGRSSSEVRLIVHVIGGCSIYAADGAAVVIRNRKAQAILAYLALTAGHADSRERLAGLLWSDHGEEQARASLRQCLKQLREVFATSAIDALQTERRDVALSADSVRLDIDDVLGDLAAGRGTDPGTERLDPKRILYGFEGLDQSFDAWLHVIRQRWHDHLVASLEQHLRSDEIEDMVGQRIAEALLGIDPTHEEAHRYLIRAFARNGNVAAALRQYSSLWRLLDEEYDMEPAEETQSLIVRIKSGMPEPEAAVGPSAPQSDGSLRNESPPAQGRPVGRLAPTLAANRRRMIVVDRFATEGIAIHRGYVVNGFRQSLIASLVRFRDWVVVEGSDVDRRPATSQAPHPHYQVQATAFDLGATIDLVLTLKESGTGHYVWSDRYSLDLERWVDAQRLIVRRIAVALNVHTSAELLTRLAAETDVPAAIHDRWLRGQDLYLRWRPEDSRRASEIFRSIIDEAPDFAPAYSSLVQILNSRHIIFPGLRRSREREAEALSLAQTAVRLDPLDSKAHLCLAWSNALNQRFDQAELNFDLAFDLNENDPWTLVSSSHGIAFCGRKAEALARADQALHLGLGVSAIHWAYQAGIRFLCEDYEGCVRAADLAQDAILDLGGWKSAALAHLGDRERALEEGNRFVGLIRSNWHGGPDSDGSGVGAWLLHNFPFRDERDRDRLRNGLHGAGVPVPPATAPRSPIGGGYPQRDSE